MPMDVVAAGEPPIALKEHSQRLRYEAFSHLATQVNQATGAGQVGQALARHGKFILDAFLLRLLHVHEASETVIEIARGACVVRESDGSDGPPDGPSAGFYGLEGELLRSGLPLQLADAGLREHAALQGSLFDHPKARCFFALPLLAGDCHRAVLSVCSKDAPFGLADFRLVRLIGELVAGKLAQLQLAAKVAAQNRELGEANRDLVTLNEQVREMNVRLEGRVERRTGQLKRANEELATIFYRTSHDFRRPLTTLLGLLSLAEMTAREMALRADEAAHPVPEAIHDGITDLLDFFGQGKGVIRELDGMLTKLSTLSLLQTPPVRREPVDFEQLLGQLREKFASDLHRHQVALTVCIGEAAPYYGAGDTISVILENLLENAIQFRGDRPAVEIRVYPGAAGRLVMQVIDNGEGIEPAWHDQIFDLYVRASERSKGNGLGLYVVRKSVEQLGGTVAVESQPGRGAAFTVTLPCLPAPAG